MTTLRRFRVLAMLLLAMLPMLAAARSTPPAAPGARPASTPIDLGVLPGGLISSARAINDAGQVVGASQVGTGAVHAFL